MPPGSLDFEEGGQAYSAIGAVAKLGNSVEAQPRVNRWQFHRPKKSLVFQACFSGVM
jgi:hypothetical protein